jgi:hypothetical protein
MPYGCAKVIGSDVITMITILLIKMYSIHSSSLVWNAFHFQYVTQLACPEMIAFDVCS